MPKWLRREQNIDGEWCVLDLIRDYRICAYHVEHHGGVHLHHPIQNKEAVRVDVRSPSEADALMRYYAEREDVFRLERFQEVSEQWRFESRNG